MKPVYVRSRTVRKRQGPKTQGKAEGLLQARGDYGEINAMRDARKEGRKTMAQFK